MIFQEPSNGLDIHRFDPVQFFFRGNWPAVIKQIVTQFDRLGPADVSPGPGLGYDTGYCPVNFLMVMAVYC